MTDSMISHLLQAMSFISGGLSLLDYHAAYPEVDAKARCARARGC